MWDSVWGVGGVMRRALNASWLVSCWWALRFDSKSRSWSHHLPTIWCVRTAAYKAVCSYVTHTYNLRAFLGNIWTWSMQLSRWVSECVCEEKTEFSSSRRATRYTWCTTMLMRLHCWPPRPGNGARSKIARGINYYCYGWRMCGGTMCNRCMNTTRHSTIKPRAIVYGLSEYIYSFRHYYYNNKWVMENRIVHILYVAWMVGVATIILREVNMRGRDIRYLTHSLKRVYICNICITYIFAIQVIVTFSFDDIFATPCLPRRRG